jgi:aldehyde dehydrogenase (NAD+)
MASARQRDRVEGYVEKGRAECARLVLSVIAYTDEGDAVRIADDSGYGLGGAVWTAGQERGLRIGRRIHAGTVGLSRYTANPAAPFGGF